MIEIADLRFAWPGAQQNTLAIDSLHMAVGQRVFLHGPSGCGKSTLLALMAGVLTAQSGHLKVLGQDWRKMSGPQRDRFRADHVGLIFQQFNLLPYLSALDNVCLPCSFSKRRSQAVLAHHESLHTGAESLLAQMKLAPDLWRKPAAQLSVGQQQRVAAARALMGDPDLLIADEPTSALDSARRDDFMLTLMKACSQAGEAGTPKTLIFVSHDERLAAHFDTRIALDEINLASRHPGEPSA